MTNRDEQGQATVLVCPQCAGALYEAREGGVLRFRCAQGHGYAPEEICPGIADDLQGLLPDVVGALTR